jgi:hypothetical protein
MHFALLVHFYCPMVSLLFNFNSFLADNVKCRKRSNSSGAIANDPNDSASPSPKKSEVTQSE